MAIAEQISVLQFKTSSASAVILQELLAPFCCSSAVRTDMETQAAVVDVYYDAAADREQHREQLVALLADWVELVPDSVEVVDVDLAREDWAETWKQYFHPVDVSPRIAVKPTWEDLPAGWDKDCVIEIDPGMSFGTGQHGTTVACLRLVDQLSAEGRVGAFLDVGCGSGILTIAAAKLGFDPIVAFDFDPVAVVSAKQNLGLNSIDSVTCVAADLSEYRSDCPYKVVVANLQSHILLANCDRLRALVAPGDESRLVVSGILEDQYGDVRDAFVGRGFEELQSTLIDEWKTGCFYRPE